MHYVICAFRSISHVQKQQHHLWIRLPRSRFLFFVGLFCCLYSQRKCHWVRPSCSHNSKVFLCVYTKSFYRIDDQTQIVRDTPESNDDFEISDSLFHEQGIDAHLDHNFETNMEELPLTDPFTFSYFFSSNNNEKTETNSENNAALIRQTKTHLCCDSGYGISPSKSSSGDWPWTWVSTAAD
jgi:hypothetical protein